MDIGEFFRDVLEQNKEKLQSYFHEKAVILWHSSNELFTVEEYIRANCEYPGQWDGEIERIEKTEQTIIMIASVHSADKARHFHLVSFLEIANNLITRMDEYRSADEAAPEWRRLMKIGRKIV